MKLTAIVDRSGRILAAELGEFEEESRDGGTPAAKLSPALDQHLVEMEVPDELAQVSDAGLTQFFSDVEVSWPAEVKIPRLEVRRPDESSST